MAVIEERSVVADGLQAEVFWSAVTAGAIATAALSFVLIAFGSAIGLALVSASPTWRDSSAMLWMLSGTFLVFTALVSSGLGGYIAGRMRGRLPGMAAGDMVEFHDGMHGLLSWALAILLSAVLAIGAARAIAPAVVPGGNQDGASTSIAGENSIAYEIDQLLRSDRAPRDTDLNYTRGEAARILLTSSSHSGVLPEDRDYLVRIVTARAGLSQQQAQARVDATIAGARDALKRARESGITVAFATAASLLLGAVVAWFAAREGGRERERDSAPVWHWSLSRRSHVAAPPLSQR
ncbi:MAG TPA: hypothetical protein VGI20_07505 [Rhizomicrobium sp.]|jgi:hypothetical protein